MADFRIDGGFGLYVHWPFCEAKCPYCDFNSHVSREIDQSLWRDSYLAEIDRVGKLTKGRILETVFFGGGTPSLMDPDVVSAIIERVRRTWPMVNDPEITLEANPSSVEAGRFKAYAEAGVNRVSMGIQALNDTDLARLGRLHDTAEARAAFDIARRHFDRVSFDLIYARQGQAVTEWKAELTDALSMAVDHLSLYQLTIEPGTAFGDRLARGRLSGLPSDDRAAMMYEATQEICDRHGMPAYEISNHARPGSESRHNLIYWRYGDYAGIGPGAHSRLTLNGAKEAREAWKQPDKWLRAMQENGADRSIETLDPADQADEYMMMALRLSEGVSASRYADLHGQPLNADVLTYLQDIGVVTFVDDRIAATDRGRLVLNAVIEKLLTD